MLLARLQAGLLLLRDGLVGLGADCCCGCCCIEGVADPDKKTQEDCESAGGTWHSGAACVAYDCRCCEGFKFICVERVHSTYSATYPAVNTPDFEACQPSSVNDTTAGVIAIDSGNIEFCTNQSDGQYCTNEWGADCDGAFAGPEDSVGQTYTYFQYYERWRVVSDCSECEDTGGEPCTPGISLTSCAQISLPVFQALCDCGLIDLCADEEVP